MVVQLLIGVALFAATEEFASRFPEDDLVVKNHETRITLLADGKARVWQRRVTRPLTLYGREEFSDYRIPYFAPLQTVRMIACKGIDADGKGVEAEPHAFNPVTPQGYGRAPDFVRFRELVVSPPGVAEDVDIINEWVVEDSAAVFPWYEASITLGERHPVLLRTVRIENLSGQPLRWQVQNVEGGQPGQDSTAVWWTFRDLPAYPTSGAGPLAESIVPRLLLTTCPSWEALSSWCYASTSTDSLAPSDVVDSLSAKMKKAVTRRDSLDYLAEVVRDVTLLVPSPKRRFWMCRPFNRIMETGRAEPWEICSLLAALGRSTGYQTTVCLVGPPLARETLPVLDLFDKSMVLVGGEPTSWLDRDGTYDVPWRAGAFSVLPFHSQGGEITSDPGVGPAVGTARFLFLSAGDDSLQVKGYISLSGVLIPEDVDKGDPADWLKARLSAVVGEGCVSDIVPEVLGPERCVYRFEGGLRVEERTEIDGHLEGIFGDDWIPPGSARHRTMPRVPIHIPEPIDLAVEVRIEQSELWTVLYPGDPVMKDEKPGRLVIETTSRDGQIIVRRALELYPGWLDQSAVEAVRLLLAVEGQTATRMVIMKP